MPARTWERLALTGNQYRTVSWAETVHEHRACEVSPAAQARADLDAASALTGAQGPARVTTRGGGQKEGGHSLRDRGGGSRRPGSTARTGTARRTSQNERSGTRTAGKRNASPPSSRLTHSNQTRIMLGSWFFVCGSSSQGSVLDPAACPACSAGRLGSCGPLVYSRVNNPLPAHRGREERFVKTESIMGEAPQSRQLKRQKIRNATQNRSRSGPPAPDPAAACRSDIPG